MKTIRPHLPLVIILLLCSCATPANPPYSSPTHTPTFIFTNIPPSTCQTAFEHRELREPYRRGTDDMPRFTLNTAELQTYYDLMHIESLCLPPEVGPPFINADWNVGMQPSVRGRMVSLGFEDTYSGSGWSRIFLVYSTYDFSAGTEYDRFMTADEWTTFQAGTLKGVELLPDGRGFTRYKAGLYFGSYPIYKTHVFPFEDGYAALVINLGTYEGEFDTEVAGIQQGELPDDVIPWLPVFEQMAASLK